MIDYVKELKWERVFLQDPKTGALPNQVAATAVVDQPAACSPI